MNEEAFKKLASYTLELAEKIRNMEKQNWETRRALYEIATGAIEIGQRSDKHYSFLKK